MYITILFKLSQAWRLWKEGDPTELIDDCFGESYVISEALHCIQVGLLCLHHPNDRPNIKMYLWLYIKMNL